MTDDPDNVIPIAGKKPKRPISEKQRAANQRNLERAKELTGVRPARSKAADKGGDGWGGPAKGAGNRGPGPGRPTKAISQMKAEERAALELELAQLKYDLAHDAEFEATRLAAINSLENRLLGLPKAAVALMGGEEGENPIQQKITVEFVKAK